MEINLNLNLKNSNNVIELYILLEYLILILNNNMISRVVFPCTTCDSFHHTTS